MNKLSRAIGLLILLELLVAACTPAFPPISSITAPSAPTQTQIASREAQVQNVGQ